MALLDFLKSKQKAEKRTEKKAAKQAEKQVEKKAALKEVEHHSEKSGRIAKSVSRKLGKPIGEAYKVLLAPHVTEKASDLSGKNQYVFKVWPKANKTAIRKAVAETYQVNVVKVMIVNVPKRKRRLGRIEGFRKGYKKAIVEIAQGQKIEIMPR